jgi:branched-subunit amino acid ABC-type transport system permease component
MLSALLDGAFLAPPYVVLALAYGLVYGMMGMMDLSVAARFTAAAYGGFFAQEILAWHPGVDPAVWLVATCASVVVGGVFFWLLMPLLRQPVLTMLVGSLGLSYALQSVYQGALGATPRVYAHYPVEAGIEFLGTDATPLQLGAAVYAAVACLVTALLLRHGDWRRRVLAVAGDHEIAAAVFAVPRSRVAMEVTVLASILVAPAGVLYAASHGVSPTTGVDMGLLAFVAAIVVGRGRPLGAAVMALLLIVLRSVAIRWPLPNLLVIGVAWVTVVASLPGRWSTVTGALRLAAVMSCGALALALSRRLPDWARYVVIPGSFQDVVPYTVVGLLLVLRPDGVLASRLPRAV